MIPTITWAQTSNYILLKIIIDKVTDLNLSFNNNMLCVKGKSDVIEYNLNEKLYKEIDTDMTNHTYKIFDSYIDCKLKKSSDEEWDFLIIDHIKHKTHIKIDWLRWGIEEEDEDIQTNDNFENLMNNMGMDPSCLDKSCLGKNCSEHTKLDNVPENLNGIQSGESTPCTSDEELLE